MNIKEMRSANAADLKKNLTELRREQFNLRMQVAGGQGVKTHDVSRVRKDIARSKMVLGEKSRKGA
jgi:large subunit ribosomal protein L29